VTGRAEEAAGLGDAVRIRFDLPVVLPPPGRYSVLVGAPWQADAPALRADRPASGAVDGDGLTLVDGNWKGSGERLRVVFVT
jgi:hypothetical protein